MADREIKQWITVNGRRVPIFEGESKEEAVNKFIKSSKSTTPENDDDAYFSRRHEMRKAEQEAESVKNKARIKREYDRIAEEEKTKEKQIAQNKAEADRLNYVISKEDADKQLERADKKYATKQIQKDAEHRATSVINRNMSYSELYNKLKSMGLNNIFEKKYDSRGIGKTPYDIAKAVLVSAIKKGKI